MSGARSAYAFIAVCDSARMKTQKRYALFLPAPQFNISSFFKKKQRRPKPALPLPLLIHCLVYLKLTGIEYVSISNFDTSLTTLSSKMTILNVKSCDPLDKLALLNRLRGTK